MVYLVRKTHKEFLDMKKRMTIRFNNETIERLEEYAGLKNETASGLVREAVRNLLNKIEETKDLPSSTSL